MIDTPLKSLSAEGDAQSIAEVWIKKGYEAAAEAFNILTVKLKLKTFEWVILADRVRALIKSNGLDYKTLT